MYPPKKKAFTLTELLVVLIVLGVLAAVAVPKFVRILETRKTAEAESFLEAVRTEQEKRCVFGKDYLGEMDKVHVATTAPRSGQYSYRLLKKGMAAESRSKDYTLRVPSYKDGRLCCEGPYCSKLNKDYPLCADLTNLSYDDECSADVEESCLDNAKQAKCCSATQKWDGSKCVAKTYCELHPDECTCNPYQAKCCTETQKWDGSKCVAKSFCELNPDDCTCNPDQQKCCDKNTQKWDGSSCVALTECDKNPASCACDTYAAAHAEECDENSCLNKPNQEKCCDTATQKWDGTECVALTECEINPDQEACCDPATEKWDGTTCVLLTECELNPDQEACCDPDTEKWDGTECVALTECEINPDQEQCCDAATEKWDGTTCVPLTECELNPDQEACCDPATEKWDGTTCVPLTECELNPNQEACCDPATQKWDGTACVALSECEMNPNQEQCCDPATQKWDGASCIPLTECELNPNQEQCCSGDTPYWDGSVCTVKPQDVCETDPYGQECCDTKEGYAWTGSACVQKKCENEYFGDPCPSGEYSGGQRNRICDANCQNCKWDYSNCIERQDCYNSNYFDTHVQECCAELRAAGDSDWRCCSSSETWDVDLMECITCTPSYRTERMQMYYVGNSTFKRYDTGEVITKTCPSANYTCPANQEARYNAPVCQTFSAGFGGSTQWDEIVSYSCSIKGDSGPTGGVWERCDCDDVMAEMARFFGVNTYGNTCAGPSYAEQSMITTFRNSGLRHVTSMDAFNSACSSSGWGGGPDSKDGAWYISGRTMYVKACKGGYSWLDVTEVDCCPQSYRWE